MIYIEKYIEKYKKLKKKYCSKSLNNEDCLGLYNFVGQEIKNHCKGSKSNKKYDCSDIKSIFCPIFTSVKECNSQVSKR